MMWKMKTSFLVIIFVLVPFVPSQQSPERASIIQLDAPNRDYVTKFQWNHYIPCYGNISVANTSVETLESVVVSLRSNLPSDVEENEERLTIPSYPSGLGISINTKLKTIIFTQQRNLSIYVNAIRSVRYFNGENDTYPIDRFVDFMIIPGGNIPNDTVTCVIKLLNETTQTTESTIDGQTSTPELTTEDETESSASFADVPTTAEISSSDSSIHTLPTNVCSFSPSNLTMQLCKAFNLEPKAQAEFVANITTNIDIQPEEFSVIISHVESLTEYAISCEGNVNDSCIEIRENYLRSVDNLLQVNGSVVEQTQNASQRLLTNINFFADNVQLPNGTNSTTFIGRVFAILIRNIDPDDYDGETVTIVDGNESAEANSSLAEDNPTSVISSTPGTLHNVSGNVTATVKIPMSVFKDVGLNSSNSSGTHRISVTSIANGTQLFQSSAENQSNLTLISGVVGVRVNGSTEDKKLSSPIQVVFKTLETLKSQFEYHGGIWEGDEDAWSLDGNTKIDDKGAKVKYYKTGHFGLLLDLTYGLMDPLPEEYSLTLYTISIIGVIVSLLCLALFLITFLAIRKLRTSEHSQILINMCVALMCSYVVYLVAAHASPVPVLCALSAALLQYFLLVFFGWTAAEAFFLYRGLVKVLVKEMNRFVLKAGLIVWLLPLIIVALSVGPGYDFYYSEEHGLFCRARELPFWVGFIAPFLIIYAFNWVMFCLILVSLCRRKSKHSDKSDMKLIKQNVTIAISLAVLFGLGWGFGLAASSTGNSTLTFAFQVVFAIFVGLQGVFIFALHGIKQWKKVFKVTGRKPLPNSASGMPSPMLNSRSRNFNTNMRYTTVEKLSASKTETSLADISEVGNGAYVPGISDN